MSSVIAYRRPDGRGANNHSMQEMAETIRLIAKLQGLSISTSGWHDEQSADSTNTIDHLVNATKPGDTIIIPSITAFSHMPSKAIEIASKFIAKGVRIVAADAPGGNLDLQGLRANLIPMAVLERKVEELQAELAAKDAEHEAEFDQFQAALEAKTIEFLGSRGITLTHLLRTTGDLSNTSIVARPFEGKQLKQAREALGYTQAEIAAMLDPPVDKSVISKIEAEGSAHLRYEDYKTELMVAEILAEQAAKTSRQPKPAPAHMDAELLSRIST